MNPYPWKTKNRGNLKRHDRNHAVKIDERVAGRPVESEEWDGPNYQGCKDVCLGVASISQITTGREETLCIVTVVQ